MQPQPPAPLAQHEAIREVRDRYERGEFPVEVFKRALDALLEARSPEECRAVIESLPPSPARALEALDAAARPPAAPALAVPRTRWMVMILGELKRTKRPWKLGQHTTCVALVGETRLDLSLATLPARGVLRIFALLGEVKVTVPRGVAVRVRSVVLLGETTALGEHAAGIVAVGHADSRDDVAGGAAEPPVAELEIEVVMGLGEVKVVQVDAPALASGGAAGRRALSQPQ
jgi:hypothetical protein